MRLGMARKGLAHINRDRLLTTLGQLSRYGADGRGGVTREAFTPADDAARAYLADEAARAGLQPSVDPAGNLIVRPAKHASGRPVLLMGSHLDSVTGGGRLDGAYGVVAALETLRTFTEQDITTRLEPVMIAFSNEEGALFPYPFWGSLAVAGRLQNPEAVTDHAGRSIREPLARAGGDLDRIAAAAWPADAIAAFLELHIEQGPVLDGARVPIGVVDGIVGRSVFDITVLGQQNHAGTTPMDCRADALAAAARVVLAVEDVAKHRRLCAVGTAGSLTAKPGCTNVIPSSCSLSVEIRDSRVENLTAAEAALIAEIAKIEHTTGTRIVAEVTMRTTPVRTDESLAAAVAASATELGLSHLTLSSGAGHDAQIIGAVAPIGMIFVPSRGGLSHTPLEDTDDADLVTGAQVLARTAARLAM